MSLIFVERFESHQNTGLLDVNVKSFGLQSKNGFLQISQGKFYLK